MSNQSFQYIEDNGGELFLFVFDAKDKVIAGIGNLEYAQPGEWHEVKDELANDALHAVRTWEGHFSNAADVYEELHSGNFGEVVADEDGIRPSRMGRAAQIYFGVDTE